MINQIIVTNYRGDSLTIDTRFPEQSGFLVKDATGLGPSKGTINYTEMMSGDGGAFNSARVNARNIVLTLQMLTEPTVEEVRQKSYRYFPVKKPISLEFITDNRTCTAYGYVETNEPLFFAEMTTTQISIICPDPYLYSTGPDGTNVTVFSGIDPQFEFPFENLSTTENLISVSQIVTNQEQNVVYNGDAEIGVVIYIHAMGAATNINIYNSGTREIMKIDTAKLTALTGEGLHFGDDIIISTITGNKSVTLLRDGEYTNVLNCLDKGSDWFKLAKGDNIFAYSAATGAANLQFRVENQTLFEGV